MGCRVSLVFVCLCLGFAWALAGCGPARTYSGPRLPRDQTAVLQIRGTGSDIGMVGETRYMVTIRKLNGRPYRGAKSILEVLPGTHEVEMRWHKMQVPYWPGNDVHADRYDWRPIANGTVTLTVEAEAGMSYELDWPDDDRDVPPGPPHGFVPIVR